MEIILKIAAIVALSCVAIAIITVIILGWYLTFSHSGTIYTTIGLCFLSIFSTSMGVFAIVYLYETIVDVIDA